MKGFIAKQSKNKYFDIQKFIILFCFIYFYFCDNYCYNNTNVNHVYK